MADKVGRRVLCRWKDGTTHNADIIDVRTRRKPYSQEESKDGSNGHEYYVHYVDHNRRLDEWVTADRFEAEAEVDAAKGGTQSGNDQTGAVADGRRVTRREKREI